MIHVTTEGREFVIDAPASCQPWCRMIPARSWDSGRKSWIAPATPCAAFFLKHRCPVPIDGDEKFKRASQALLDMLAIQKAQRFPAHRTNTSLHQPFHHQREVFWMMACLFQDAHLDRGKLVCPPVTRDKVGGGFELVHDMGTGKSRSVVDLTCHFGYRRVLIVCPKSVIPGWTKQFAMYADTSIVHPAVLLLGKRPVPKRAQQLADAHETAGDGCLVAVVNFEAAWRPPFGPRYEKKGKKRVKVEDGLLETIPWDLVVPDESHRIKDPKGAASTFIRSLAAKCPRRINMTGTPMGAGGPLDMWAQMAFVDVALYGTSYYAFTNRYAVKGGFEGKQVVAYKNQDDFKKKMALLSHRVESDDVLDLPPATHIEVPIELSDAAQKMYRRLESDFVVEVDGGEVDVSTAIVEMLRLQQLTGGYLTIDKGEDEHGKKQQEIKRLCTAKRDAIQTKLEDLPASEAVAIFCRFKADFESLREAAEGAKRPFYELRGGLNQRDEWEKAALAEEGAVIGVQIQAGGVGIDLTAARYVGFLSIGHQLINYLQALKRSHRQGQTRHVFYLHFIATDTIDEDVYAAIQKGKNIVDHVLEEIKGGRIDRSGKTGEGTMARSDDHADGAARRKRSA